MQYHTCAALIVGGFACWGYNGLGQVRQLTTIIRVLSCCSCTRLPQLGLGDTTDRLTPTRINALVNSTVVIAAAGAVSVKFYFCWVVGCAHFQRWSMLIVCSTTPASAPAVAGSCVGDIMVRGRCGRDIIASVCMPHVVLFAVGRRQLFLELHP